MGRDSRIQRRPGARYVAIYPDDVGRFGFAAAGVIGVVDFLDRGQEAAGQPVASRARIVAELEGIIGRGRVDDAIKLLVAEGVLRRHEETTLGARNHVTTVRYCLDAQQLGELLGAGVPETPDSGSSGDSRNRDRNRHRNRDRDRESHICDIPPHHFPSPLPPAPAGVEEGGGVDMMDLRPLVPQRELTSIQDILRGRQDAQEIADELIAAIRAGERDGKPIRLPEKLVLHWLREGVPTTRAGEAVAAERRRRAATASASPRDASGASGEPRKRGLAAAKAAVGLRG